MSKPLAYLIFVSKIHSLIDVRRYRRRGSWMEAWLTCFSNGQSSGVAFGTMMGSDPAPRIEPSFRHMIR